MRGTQTQFSTEYVSHQQDEDGVTVRVLNRLTGHGYTIRAKYLIGGRRCPLQGGRRRGTALRGADGYCRFDEYHFQS